MHVWVITIPISNIWNCVVTYLKFGNLETRVAAQNTSKCNIWNKVQNIVHSLIIFCILDVALPVCVFMALYGKTLFGVTQKGVQYWIAASIILTSRRFMLSIAKFPIVGGKVYMLTKVYFQRFILQRFIYG